MAHPVWHGYTACDCIVASGPLVEKRFREAGLIVQDFSGLVSQGCYSNGAVAASAGTHDGGGVLDLKDWTPYRADTDALFTACGWIDFYRPYGILYAKSPAHHHVVVNGCPHLSYAAQRQLTDAKAGLNGLAGKGKDSGPLPLKTWQQAVAEDSGTIPAQTQTAIPQEDDDVNSYIFMRTIETSNPIYLLAPGRPVHHLTPQEWTLWARLGAKRLGGDFNRAEVDIVNAQIQPA